VIGELDDLVRRWGRAVGRVAVASVTASLLAAVSAPHAGAVPTSESWAAELSVADGDDANVAVTNGAVRLVDRSPRATSTGQVPAEGELLLPPRRPAAVTDRVAATVTADRPSGSQVLVSVRGIRADGTWSQWSVAADGKPAILPEPTFEIQVRVTLVAAADGTGPALRRLYLTADRAPAAAPRPTTTPAVEARVFATRIGLEGNRTANGHRVVADDRFIALPSRRGLSPRDTGDYTVKVCADNGKCTWAPVWDVGPWNTTDDYWNRSDVREQFADLPRGTPEAQAASQDGYHRGRDGSGRRVANPAGIDLADGTFRDDLGLTDNSWVTATYLFTGTGPSGPARDGDATVTVRSRADATAPSVGTVAPRARVAVECSTSATTPAGRTAASDRWLRIGAGQFVPADAIEVSDVAAC